MNKTRIQSSAGFTLLEALLALVVVVAVMFLATRYYQVVRLNYQVAEAVKMINTLVDASYRWLEGHPNFTGITKQALVDLKYVPETYASSSLNPWKGDIDLRGALDNGSGLLITFYNIPSKACEMLKARVLLIAKKQPSPACGKSGQASVFTAIF